MYWTREVDNMKIAAAGLYSLFLLTGLGDGTAAFGLNYDEPVSDYDYYYDVNLESISVEPGEEGFAIITITAVGCVNTTLKKIMVKSCDGEFTKEYFDKQCMDKLCLPNNFNKNCVRVKYGNVSSTNVILPPYKVYNQSNAPIANAWHHHHSTNTSRIWVLLMDGVFTYRLQLKPLETYNHQNKSCKSKKNFSLYGDLTDRRVTFTANWSQLDTACEYESLVFALGSCLQNYDFGHHTESLVYIAPPKQEEPIEEMVLPEWVVALVTVLATLMIVVAAVHLIKTWKHTHDERGAMVVNTGGNRDDSWLKGIVQQQQNAPTKRNVLIVYAQDVKHQVAAFISLLQQKTPHQILDLYDPMDLEKLSDGTMWLMRKLLHPATVTLLVASKEARRLQLQHTSLSMSAGQNLHGNKPQFTPETKNRKIQTEITPSQKTTLMNPTRDDKTGDMIFNHTFVQNTTEKNVYGLENNSPTIQAEVKPKEVSDIDSEEKTVEGQENTTNRENTSLGCNNTNNFSDGKENGGTQDNTQAVTAEEGAFHFLLVDFLHKLESSFFSQDYKRLYQIQFKETPEEALLNHVTPGRVYRLPGHLDHLLHALACPPVAAEKELTQQTTAEGGIPV